MLDLNRDDIYLIGEIGINHSGDIQIAKKLIDAIHCCGWNCAKFQKRNPDKCVPEHQKNVMRDTPWGRMTYLQYKYKLEFGIEQYDYIDKYCNEKPIDWSASVWDIDSLNFLLQYKIPFIKIPSALITNLELVSESAKSLLPMIISTGMSTIQEIDTAVNETLKYNKNLVIMHTNSEYPAPHNDLNLLCIPMLKERYNCTIGYSGHEEDVEPTVVACTLGARVVERHITISHSLWGTDQKASLEVMGMDILAKRIKDIPVIMGDGNKRITDGELEKRNQLRKN